jgi:hypothetical protein
MHPEQWDRAGGRQDAILGPHCVYATGAGALSVASSATPAWGYVVALADDNGRVAI